VVVVLLDQVVEGQAEGFEDQAVELVVVERFEVANDVVLVGGVFFVEFLHDVAFRLRRLYVFGHWLYHLLPITSTFIA
jgi:hypothetical protein